LFDGDERTTLKSALRAEILMKYDESSQRAFDELRAKQTTTTPAEVVVALIVMSAHLRRARLERESLWNLVTKPIQ